MLNNLESSVVKQKQHRIFWQKQEWEILARELYRIKPLDSILRSSTLATLDHVDFKKIQEILPHERRRFCVPSLVPIRKNLLPHMRKIREEIDAEAEAAKIEVSKAIQEEAQTPKISSAPVNSYEAVFATVFAPIVNLIAAEISKAIVGQVQASLQSQVTQMIADITHTPITNTPVQSYTLPVETKVKTKRLKFAVIGAMSVQAQDIQTTYPMIDFLCIESSAAAVPEAVHSCDKIIGMTDFMRHGADGIMKLKFGAKYHRTGGSVSAVKRLIKILLSEMKNTIFSTN